MSEQFNHLNQPIGFPMPDWQPRPWPPRTTMHGRYCRVEPLQPDIHAADLYQAYSEDTEGRNWTYLSIGPFSSFTDFQSQMELAASSDDPLFHAIINLKSGKAEGAASYLRIKPTDGVIEVGGLNFAPRLQRTAAATEAMYLMMCRAFDELGYRRYEWKCDALNAPSRRAAERLGFTFEGIFRQAVIYKGRSRDTAWYSIIDTEWPHLKAALEKWLEPGNFDAHGIQRTCLEDFR